MIFWFSYQVGAVFRDGWLQGVHLWDGRWRGVSEEGVSAVSWCESCVQNLFKCLLALFYCLIHLLIRIKNIKKMSQILFQKIQFFGNSFLYQFVFHSALNSTFQIISLFCIPFYVHLQNGFQYCFWYSVWGPESVDPQLRLSLQALRRGDQIVPIQQLLHQRNAVVRRRPELRGRWEGLPRYHHTRYQC